MAVRLVWGAVLSVALVSIITIWPTREDPEYPDPQTYSRLHQQFDPLFPGRGRIDYGPGPVADIAKAYAMVLKAELNRRRTGALPNLSSLVDSSGIWLLDNSDADSDGIVGWGVPLEWDAFGDGSVNPADTEYTISTAISADALLDWMDQDGSAPRKRIIAVVTASFEPYLKEENLSPSGLFPYSLEEQDRTYDVFNPAAYLAGQMQRLSKLVVDQELSERLSRFADRTVEALLNYRKTDPSGNWYWAYSVQEDRIPNDLAHAVYVMYGLAQYIRYGGRLSKSIRMERVVGHLAEFISGHGDYVYGWPEFRKDITTPARSYGVGMALFFSSSYPGMQKQSMGLAKAVELYELPDGRYAKYPERKDDWLFFGKQNDRTVIQEYQAYILLGLSFFLFQERSGEGG